MADHKNTLSHCLNCSTVLSQEDSYCPSCGQKTHDGKLPVFQVISDFFTNEFNLDSKFITSFLALFLPGKLTKEYFLGKRKSHLNPIRFFFFVLVFALAWANSDRSKSSIIDINDGNIDLARDAANLRFYDSLVIILEEQQIDQKDTLLRQLREKMEISKASLDIFSDRELVNSLFRLENVDTSKISPREYLLKTPDEIVSDRGLTGLAAAYFRQRLKLEINPKELEQFVANNLAWMILSFIPLITLFMKLLYFRSKRFFIEHLVFTMHMHTAFVVLLVLGALIDDFLGLEGGSIALAVMWFSIYLFLSLKRYYSQSFIKSLFKYLMLLVMYTVLLIIFISLASLVSLALF